MQWKHWVKTAKADLRFAQSVALEHPLTFDCYALLFKYFRSRKAQKKGKVVIVSVWPILPLTNLMPCWMHG